MLFTRTRAALILGATTITISACQPGDEEPPVGETFVVTQGSDSTVYIEDDIWIELVDQPREHFVAARKHFVAGQWDAVSSDLLKSSAFLKLQAKTAETADRVSLRTAARDLEHISKRVEDGSLTEVAVLDRVLAGAYHALAEHHRERAETAWSADHRLTVVAYLREAAWETEQGFQLAGSTIAAADQLAIDEAKDVTILDEATILSTRIASLHTTIQKLGTVVQAGSTS